MESKRTSWSARMGYGNVRLIVLPYYFQIWIGKPFRFKNGSGVAIVPTTTKYKWINDDYYSKDTLLATHSSFILPRESPLVVSQNQSCKLCNFYLLTSLYYVGHIFSLNNVAEGHGHFGQAEYWCAESTNTYPWSKVTSQATSDSQAIGHHHDHPCCRPCSCTDSVYSGAVVVPAAYGLLIIQPC